MCLIAVGDFCFFLTLPVSGVKEMELLRDVVLDQGFLSLADFLLSVLGMLTAVWLLACWEARAEY